MKRLISWMLATMLTLAALCGAAVAESVYDRLKAAQTLDEQLALLDGFATENAAELEAGGWDRSYTLNLASGLPDGVIPTDWETLQYTEADGLPDAMRGHKFIAILCVGDSDPRFAGDLLARFSADMRAASLAEAEYALIVRWEMVPSGYNYMPPAASSHVDYQAFAVNLRTGETTRFWTQRNSAKTSGKIGFLDGHIFSQEELWTILRSHFLGELRHTQADGTVLLFGVIGENCYLKGYETSGELTELIVPGEVEGHTVTEIVESCFEGNKMLRKVVLHDGLTRISDKAFNDCKALESVVLPDTLEVIGNNAFLGCEKLRRIQLPESLLALGTYALDGPNFITSITLPGSLHTIGKSAFNYSVKLARVVVSEGITSLPKSLFYWCNSLACCYLPASLTTGLEIAEITKSATIYAPEGSYALTWAAENGYAYVACASPDDMPQAEYIVEGDFEFRVMDGETALFAYLGSDANVVVPENAGGKPVTRILSHALYSLNNVESVTLPQSVLVINTEAIAQGRDGPHHVYVTNPETSFQELAIWSVWFSGTNFTIHAPEGSTTQRYVVDMADERILFEPWSE